MITNQKLSTAQSKAPLLSEGAISPFQVSNMSKREKAEREKNIQERYNIDEEYKRQNMTYEEKNKERREEIEKEIYKLNSIIKSLTFNVNYCMSLGAYNSPRMNNTKRSVLICNEDIVKHEIKIKKLKGGLNKNE